MRLRHNPHAYEQINNHPQFIVTNPKELKGRWNEVFTAKGRPDRPIKVELGMGKGGFITAMAEANPDCNFIGIDVKDELVYSGLRKIKDKSLDNVILMCFNIAFIEEAFDEGEIDTFYINFSDPWPKVRHAKRRLTHRNLLKKYKVLLKPFGEIIFKTDNRELFDFSLEEFKEADLDLGEVTYDLKSLNDPGNIPTEYEKKFMELGIYINRAKLKKKE